MAAISDNKYEIYEWVKKVMDSCETPIQLTKAQRLIKFFTRTYNDQFLRQSLYDYKDIKWRKLIDNAKNYLNIDNLFDNFLNNSEPDPDLIWNREQFVNFLLTDDEFYKKWGKDCCETLTEEERYNIWFNNNYETGMERYFDPNNLPDYDNDYYRPTPKRKLK
jgi:hypothetical protein